jgi:hypothetical protein
MTKVTTPGAVCGEPEQPASAIVAAIAAAIVA